MEQETDTTTPPDTLLTVTLDTEETTLLRSLLNPALRGISAEIRDKELELTARKLRAMRHRRKLLDTLLKKIKTPIPEET